MAVHPLAGKPVPPELLEDIPTLVAAYYTLQPDPAEPSHRVCFGTSGHRGCALDRSFNEAHILAITQAVCEHRAAAQITGPLYLGIDTHALSEPARRTALEVLAANEVWVRVQAGDGYTPTPVVSHAILTWNYRNRQQPADGIVITPSHNPPRDGGFKYNPPHGGPAGAQVTQAIEARANALLENDLVGVRRWSFARALAADRTQPHDLMAPYVSDLGAVLDMDAIRHAKLRLGVHPLGGAGVGYWGPIADVWGLDIEVVCDTVDPTFRFMTVDRDGKVRMDCSSPWAMAGLIEHRDRFDLAFANDPDADRHGIVTRQSGLLNPNHYLAAAISYLFAHRPGWPAAAGIGKTLVSSAMIDRVARDLKRPLIEVPVGFKWFVDSLQSGAAGFGGEESAGASFLRRDGRAWTTDKDGLLLNLLAAEMTAVLGQDPGEVYQALTERHGDPIYRRVQAPATRAQKAALKALNASAITATHLGGEPILDILTHAPGNGAAIGGLKVTTQNGWFAARPSGTEDIYKIYSESFRGEAHLDAIGDEAQAIVSAAL